MNRSNGTGNSGPAQRPPHQKENHQNDPHKKTDTQHLVDISKAIPVPAKTGQESSTLQINKRAVTTHTSTNSQLNSIASRWEKQLKRMDDELSKGDLSSAERSTILVNAHKQHLVPLAKEIAQFKTDSPEEREQYLHVVTHMLQDAQPVSGRIGKHRTVKTADPANKLYNLLWEQLHLAKITDSLEILESVVDHAVAAAGVYSQIKCRNGVQPKAAADELKSTLEEFRKQLDELSDNQLDLARLIEQSQSLFVRLDPVKEFFSSDVTTEIVLFNESLKQLKKRSQMVAVATNDISTPEFENKPVPDEIEANLTITDKKTVGDWTFNPITEEMGRKFSEELTVLLSEHLKAKSLYNNPPENASDNEIDKISSDYWASRENLLEKYDTIIFKQMEKALNPELAEQIKLNPVIRNRRLRNREPVPAGPSPYALVDRNCDIAYRSDITIPLKHTQVSVGKGENKKLTSASHILIDGKHAGIAMQAPYPDELNEVLQMARENDIHVLVDLTSTKDRLGARNGGPVLDWNSVAERSANDGANSPGELFIVEKTEQIEELWNDKYRAIVRSFKVTPKNGGKTTLLHQLSFNSWPDGQSLPAEIMKILVERVAELEQPVLRHDKASGGVMVNCMAGLGRTGSFLVARDVLNKMESSGPKHGQLTLNALLQVRASRSGDMIQTPYQAHEVLKLEIPSE